jgi:DNA invertase Pin-like site-specific DNA recombinase
MSAEMLPDDLLRRKASVYVRQSTQTQVQTSLKSQRRQYDLVELAKRHGFSSVEVIDDDLGRSASGSVARPGFERLVAACHRPAYWSQAVIGMWEPVADRRNGAKA